MANAIKGEVAVEATDGPLAGAYTLLMDFNALCELEEEFPGIMDGEVDIKSFKSIRRLFAEGFRFYHPDLSIEDVGAIIHSVGVSVAAEKLGEAMKASFPEAKTDGPKPRKAPAKAGAGSGR